MPIYAYRCEHCGHAQDVLQKVSDPVLTVCPACGQATYRKQVTAAGFQLKGSGWYVTDFKGDKKPPAKSPEPTDGAAAGGTPAAADGGAAKTSGDGASNGASASSDAKADGAKASAPAASPAPASKPPAPKPSDT